MLKIKKMYNTLELGKNEISEILLIRKSCNRVQTMFKVWN